ncbi:MULTISPECIES: TraR/DksA C4-type zinc finger protein [Phyllobacteriaceae]|uniref:Molecular chaperone DnaK n=1 Tax=Mesorhizobium hungaricum TaxID=1566387 RepID=A0A1C2DEI2_9HYPH|nr:MULTISPECIES: TraR/DksA C4-type zinc finger protein [Mesorhizobium]MBN9232754.1 TraR/DksA C4-type zinc finger protein [Mesorhizobium sp.]MDQ0330353.1 RNA polymerase-binding transcription factor DksA [Mesorhizobium sp. YL-MeA3-2017]OCX13148.1 molecular chaperone DnaK [Mesorhizobium hungaricum]
MKLGNFAFELADLRTEQERETGIRAAQAALAGHGSSTCVVCHEEIEPERRQALPSAKRCLACQQRLERFKRRRN